LELINRNFFSLPTLPEAGTAAGAPPATGDAPATPARDYGEGARAARSAEKPPATKSPFRTQPKPGTAALLTLSPSFS